VASLLKVSKLEKLLTSTTAPEPVHFMMVVAMCPYIIAHLNEDGYDMYGFWTSIG
jgi:hypothetical protein